MALEFSFLLPSGVTSCYLSFSSLSSSDFELWRFLSVLGLLLPHGCAVGSPSSPLVLAPVLCFYFLVILFRGSDVATLVVRLPFCR
jgi:hypothetical protein